MTALATGTEQSRKAAPAGSRNSLAKKNAGRAGSRTALLVTLQVLIVAALLAIWEIGSRAGFIDAFLFSSPSAVLETLGNRIADGKLFTDIARTLTEVVLGYLIGAVGGSIIGLGLWYSRFVADLSAPFIAAIGAIPVLAIAPMTIIWFGTGMTSKVMIVAFSCIVVALTNSYRGAQRADPDQIDLMRSFGASKNQIFSKIIAPGALPWIVQALKLNVGFAVVGAIVGEYISSDAGVGHMIQLGSSNFTVNIVLAGLAVVMVMVLALNFLVNLLERALLSWERATK